MKQERLIAIKQQALKALAARANNPAAPGVTCVVVTPHEALEMVEAVETKSNGPDQQQAVS